MAGCVCVREMLRGWRKLVAFHCELYYAVPLHIRILYFMRLCGEGCVLPGILCVAAVHHHCGFLVRSHASLHTLCGLAFSVAAA
jgi:hypothetical protein